MSVTIFQKYNFWAVISDCRVHEYIRRFPWNISINKKEPKIDRYPIKMRIEDRVMMEIVGRVLIKNSDIWAGKVVSEQLFRALTISPHLLRTFESQCVRPLEISHSLKHTCTLQLLTSSLISSLAHLLSFCHSLYKSRF